jgi:MFS family permease
MPAETAPRFATMNLTPGTKTLNMGTFYWACLTGIMLATFVPQLQPYLLTEFLNIPESQQGFVSGKMSFWGEIAIILSVGVWGSLSDKIGRRIIMAAGYGFMAVGVALYPTAETYEELLVGRIVFGIGVGAYSTLIVTLIGDYVKDDSRGKATGMLGFFNGIGALITVMLLIKLPQFFASQGQDPIQAGISTYTVAVAITAFTSILMWFGLKKHDKPSPASNEHKESFRDIAVQGFKAGRDPGIALAYAAAFVSRGNLAIVGTFFTLWLANYGTGELKLSRAEAMAAAGTIIAITQSFALFSAPVFGILTDKIDRVTALMITLFLGFLGYGSTIFIDNPFGIGMIMCGALIGMSEVGCIITSAVLINQQAPEKIRGSVIGFFNIAGAFGIMFASIVGGYLFDEWRESGPFVIFGIAALLVFIWAMLIKDKIKKPLNIEIEE